MNNLEQRLKNHLADDGDQATPEFRLDDITSGTLSVRPAAPVQRRPWTRPTLAAAAVAAFTVGGLVVATRPPQDPPPAVADQFAAIDWSTENVTFTASAFSIDVGQQTFTTSGASVDFGSDPGRSDYQTLEVTWMENDVEMRWYVYFTSDGTDWWADEFRTYDGNADGEWITFTGEFFRSPLGSPFFGDIDLNASERGLTSRLRVEGMVLEPFTTNEILPDLALADGAPPELPASLPRTGVEWTDQGSLAISLAEQTIMQECMSEAGWDYDVADATVLAESFGRWNPHPVLGIRSVQAAEVSGYHLDERPMVGFETFVQTLPPDEQAAFYEDFDGGETRTVTPITLPDGTESGATTSGGCFSQSRTAFDNLTIEQEGYRQVVQESGIDQEQVAGDTERDSRIQAALDSWRNCISDASGETAATPNELARRYAFEASISDREIDIAVADARCQAETELVDTWFAVYAEYQRFALGDEAGLFDTLALMRVEIIERANEILSSRGIEIPDG